PDSPAASPGTRRRMCREPQSAGPAHRATVAAAPSLVSCAPEKYPICPLLAPALRDRAATRCPPADNATLPDTMTACTAPGQSRSTPPRAPAGPADEGWPCLYSPIPSQSPQQETIYSSRQG